ncbi:MAG: triose-phosphate isomerase, partial [Candidatus Paceibacterota bacterium]
TGEISPDMLKDFGAEYVIVGHSERRKYLNETDELINKKVIAGLNGGLKVILCIGENLAIRRLGIKAVKKFVKNQLQKDLKSITTNYKSQTTNLIIAYEPIWAIGTGKACNPEDALEIIKFIKQALSIKYKYKVSSIKVLYGGSVDGKNVADFIKYKDIDGVLVGGASLKPKEVLEIIKKVG